MNYPPPPPAYFPSAAPRVGKIKACISILPIHLLHRIVYLTLDPRATPSRFSGDLEEERIRRIWGLFRGLKGVDRRFYLVSVSILRDTFLPVYTQLLPPGATSDPYRSSGNDLKVSSSSIKNSVFAHRGREMAVFDRFIAVRVGEHLRKIETELYEESDAEGDTLKRLQPAARIEDLLTTLPPSLVSAESPSASSPLGTQFPLPQACLTVSLTPSWAQVYLHSQPVGTMSRGRVSKDLVVEVRRQSDPEGTVRRLQEALEDMSHGLVRWGEKVL